MTDWIAADWPAPRHIIAGTMLRSAGDSALPVSGEPFFLNQVHGSDVVIAGYFDSPPSADGSVSGNSKYVCVVRTADCLPVLLCSTDGSVFGAAHAGWRGLAAGVIEKTIAALSADPADVLVWLGPAISQPSFEVGEDVRKVFVSGDPKAAECFVANSRGRWQADLYGLARQKLTAAGVLDIHGGGYCTYLDEQRFHSYRRDPACGRLVSFVGSTRP